jgi:hypothetical protein
VGKSVGNSQKTPAESPLKSEPTITVTTITSIVALLLTLLVQLGLPIDQNLANTITALIVAAWPFVTAWQVRKRVFAPDTVDAIKAEEYQSGHRAGTIAATTPEPERRFVRQTG